MKRFILTGAPSSGKTTILHALRDRGYPVIGEAATDVITAAQAAGMDEPWTEPHFLEQVTARQRDQQERPVTPPALVQFCDRSPVCTLALARYLRQPVPALLADEVERVIREQVYQRQVFFIRPLGFCTPTAARRIDYAESLVFERYHELEYCRLGFEFTEVPAGPVAERVALIEDHIRASS